MTAAPVVIPATLGVTATLCVAATLLAAVACTNRAGDVAVKPAATAPHLVQRERLSMGSELQLEAWTSDEPAALAAFEEVFEAFTRLDALMSVWHDNSDISQLNAAAGDHAVPVSKDVLDVLQTAWQVSEWTGGKFDVTFAALSDLWKFDQNQDNTIPDPQEVRRRLPLINYRDLILDEHGGTAFLRRKGMKVNLGGIGKGYAVDRGVEILRRHGFKDFLVQSGGDMYVAGLRGDRPWHLGIQDPRGPANTSFATIDLSDSTFSTSGDYERSFVKNGRRYHHIIDPATGEPSRGTRSVTLMTDSAVIADGLDTGVFVMGPKAGMALLERLHVNGVIVSDKNEVLISNGLKDRLMLVAPPTDAP